MDTHIENLVNQIMTAKERRAARQHRLIKVYGGTVISLTLNLPGGYRRYARWRQLWLVAQQALGIMEPYVNHHSSRVGLWGPETFLAVDLEPLVVKQMTVAIEKEHPLGRLFDIDVIDPSGKPVSRSRLGEPGRPCLLCDKPAIECYRNRTHSLEELITSVETMIDGGL